MVALSTCLTSLLALSLASLCVLTGTASAQGPRAAPLTTAPSPSSYIPNAVARVDQGIQDQERGLWYSPTLGTSAQDDTAQVVPAGSTGPADTDHTAIMRWVDLDEDGAADFLQAFFGGMVQAKQEIAKEPHRAHKAYIAGILDAYDKQTEEQKEQFEQEMDAYEQELEEAERKARHQAASGPSQDNTGIVKDDDFRLREKAHFDMMYSTIHANERLKQEWAAEEALEPSSGKAMSVEKESPGLVTDPAIRDGSTRNEERSGQSLYGSLKASLRPWLGSGNASSCKGQGECEGA
ncbi:uncharacterized protein MKK02DRAFT_39210 [Dioszegia hungarica]|uniref:Uncharacterized protein n=1 Tax=Dioszegia hungarica TaxID=4972 RepID=A0AA38H3K0_9TREE|nr:uncharacterized protein MKK02DRAFT_39210 [Dioszegia hungarica]KAI9633231.1 hypothetical protein MKK02DRAFT_39210 [Dioszegia hungarica]